MKEQATDYPTLEDLRKSIEWAIEQGGNDNYILNDYYYPYIWGYYLHVVKEQKGAVMVAQTHGQLAAALAGKPQPTADELPKFNIDWDIRSSITDTYLVFKKKDGEKVTMMGTFDFDTPEQGAERWLEQIKERVVKGIWMTFEEKQALNKELDKEFQDYFDAHCSDDGDCEWKEGCSVRWPGGHGLRGCRRENPDDEMWE